MHVHVHYDIGLILLVYTCVCFSLQNLFGTPEKKAAKVDLSALFMPRNVLMTNSESEELSSYYNGLLKTMQCCIIEPKNKFSILPRTEKGIDRV